MFPEGAKAQAITHVVGMLIACSLLVVNASQMIILPSCDELTMCRLSVDQSVHSTLPWCPFNTRRCLICRFDRFSIRVITEETVGDESINRMTPIR